MIHDKESLQEKFILPQSGMRGEVDKTIKRYRNIRSVVCTTEGWYSESKNTELLICG